MSDFSSRFIIKPLTQEYADMATECVCEVFEKYDPTFVRRGITADMFRIFCKPITIRAPSQSASFVILDSQPSGEEATHNNSNSNSNDSNGTNTTTATAGKLVACIVNEDYTTKHTFAEVEEEEQQQQLLLSSSNNNNSNNNSSSNNNSGVSISNIGSTLKLEASPKKRVPSTPDLIDSPLFDTTEFDKWAPMIGVSNEFISALNEKYFGGNSPEQGDVLHIFAVACYPEYMRQGFAKRLFEETVAVGKAKGFKYIVAECSNEYSARIAASLGFEEVTSIEYSSWAFNGEVPFAGIPHPHTACKFMCLKL